MTEHAHSSRRSIRLRRYDYSHSGSYFFTLCVAGHKSILGRVVDFKMQCNPAGDAAWSVWRELPLRFPAVQLDAFVVMPNHIHGILFLCSPDPRPGRASPAPTKTTASAVRRGDPWVARRDSPSRALHCDANAASNTVAFRAPSLGEIIGAFKSLSAVAINRALRRTGPVWQRNYYEHIVRSAKDLGAARLYIAQNPMQWLNDRENPGARPRRS